MTENWKAWITGYPDSYAVVQAKGIDSAVRAGAATQKASHHGEVVEINVQREGSGIRYSYFARIYQDGRIRFEGKR